MAGTMNKTAISWTTATWNPTTGCSKVSEGCRHCYAETISLKFGRSLKPWTAINAAENVIEHPDRLRAPYKLKEPSRIFVNSMSDLFHEMVSPEFRARVFEVMVDLPQHTFQILTKRPELAAAWPGPWPANVWMGTSVEDHRVAHRIDTLRGCRAQTLFLSCEPLIGPLGPVNLEGIKWVIAGGESGPHLKDGPANPRWMRHEWARELRDACLDLDIAYFFKQSSGTRTEMGTALEHEDGSFWEWQQFPDNMAAPVCVKPAPSAIARA